MIVINAYPKLDLPSDANYAIVGDVRSAGVSVGCVILAENVPYGTKFDKVLHDLSISESISPAWAQMHGMSYEDFVEANKESVITLPELLDLLDGYRRFVPESKGDGGDDQYERPSDVAYPGEPGRDDVDELSETHLTA